MGKPVAKGLARVGRTWQFGAFPRLQIAHAESTENVAEGTNTDPDGNLGGSDPRPSGGEGGDELRRDGAEPIVNDGPAGAKRGGFMRSFFW